MSHPVASTPVTQVTTPQLVQPRMVQNLMPNLVPATAPTMGAVAPSVPAPTPGVATMAPPASLSTQVAPAGVQMVPSGGPAVAPRVPTGVRPAPGRRVVKAPSVAPSAPALALEGGAVEAPSHGLSTVKFFGRSVQRRYIYLGLVVFLAVILGYLWWRGRKEMKDKASKENHDQENDEYQRLYQQQQQQMGNGRIPPQMMVPNLPPVMLDPTVAQMMQMQNVPQGVVPMNPTPPAEPSA